MVKPLELEDIAQQITTLSGVFSERFDKLEAHISRVENRLSSVEDELSGVKDSLSNVENSLSGVKERLSNVEDELSGVKGELSSVKDRLSNVEGGLVDVQLLQRGTNVRLERLEGTVEAVENDIKELYYIVAH